MNLYFFSLKIDCYFEYATERAWVSWDNMHNWKYWLALNNIWFVLELLPVLQGADLETEVKVKEMPQNLHIRQ